MKQLFANLLLLFTLMGSLHALAAEDEAATTADEQADTTAESPLDGDTDADADVEARQDDAESDTPEDITGTEEASAAPLDPNEPFVPSVQISEDLSVSFPVDI